MNIVLVEPEIPQNTGNISRTCAVTGVSLHLVGKLGFSTDDKYLKRSGLDYWHMLDLHYYSSLAELYGRYPQGRFFYATTKGCLLYTSLCLRRWPAEEFTRCIMWECPWGCAHPWERAQRKRNEAFHAPL